MMEALLLVAADDVESKLNDDVVDDDKNEDPPNIFGFVFHTRSTKNDTDHTLHD
jgi:hypothetical protein